MNKANRLSSGSVFFLSAFCIFSALFSETHAITPEPALNIFHQDNALNHLAVRDKNLIIPEGTPASSSSLSQVSIHWTGLDTERRANALIATNTPLPVSALANLRFLGLDARLANRAFSQQQFTWFYKFTPFTETGSAPLPILPEQLNLAFSLLGIEGNSRILSGQGLARCQPVKEGQPGIGLEIENYDYQFLIKGILSCGQGYSRSINDPGTDADDEASQSNHSGDQGEDTPEKKSSPTGNGDTGNGADGGGDDSDGDQRDRDSTADEQEELPPLQEQLVDIHDHSQAVATAALQLAASIGDVPFQVISWASGQHYQIDTSATYPQQWVELLEGISNRLLAVDLITNLPGEYDDDFGLAINNAWKEYIKPCVESGVTQNGI